jgi:oxygen-independent coproporphyrinogen III oxidase
MAFNGFQSELTQSFAIHQHFLEQNDISWEPLETLYLGGGTPSLWGREGAEFLKSFLNANQLVLAENLEMTLEVNPGSWTEEGIKAFQKLGVNRYSLGVQALDSKMLGQLDRVHSLEDVHQTLGFFNKLKLNFSVDFMLGLPVIASYQRDIAAELEKIMSYNPPHLSLYILTPKGNYPHTEFLPENEQLEREYLEVSEFLEKRGYLHYEVSNFARPGRESRHNLKYWRSESVAALGPSATGYLADSRLRYKWKVSELEFVPEQLSEKEAKLENFYLRLRTFEGVILEEFFTSAELLKIAPIVSKWQRQGWCETRQNKLILRPSGYIRMDGLLEELFQYTNSL